MIDSEDVFEGETWRGELGLELAHSDGVSGVFCLGAYEDFEVSTAILQLNRGF